jgi:hypothetical protein
MGGGWMDGWMPWKRAWLGGTSTTCCNASPTSPTDDACIRPFTTTIIAATHIPMPDGGHGRWEALPDPLPRAAARHRPLPRRTGARDGEDPSTAGDDGIGIICIQLRFIICIYIYIYDLATPFIVYLDSPLNFISQVHLSVVGHPVLGDLFYAPRSVQALSPDRVCLHAETIAFIHPGTQAPVRFHCPYPAEWDVGLEAVEPGKRG